MTAGVCVDVRIDVRTVSEANAHAHWRSRQRRAKTQRMHAGLVVLSVKRRLPPLPLVVTITRVAPRALDDDNLGGSQKHVRDGIADALGIDDRDPRVSWRYAQRRGAPKEYAVEVRIERVQVGGWHAPVPVGGDDHRPYATPSDSVGGRVAWRGARRFCARGVEIEPVTEVGDNRRF